MWARVQRHIAGLVRQLCSGSRVGTTRRSTGPHGPGSAAAGSLFFVLIVLSTILVTTARSS